MRLGYENRNENETDERRAGRLERMRLGDWNRRENEADGRRGRGLKE